MLKTCRNTGFPLRYFLKPIHWCSKTWPAYHSPHCIPINTPFNPRLQWFANIDQYIPINYSISQQNITIKNRQKKTCFLVRSPDCGWLGPPISMLWNHEKNPSKSFGSRTISIRRPRSAANANSAKLRKTETEGQHGCVWKLSLNRRCFVRIQPIPGRFWIIVIIALANEYIMDHGDIITGYGDIQMYHELVI